MKSKQHSVLLGFGVLAAASLCACQTSKPITAATSAPSSATQTPAVANNAKIVEALTGDWAITDIDSKPVAGVTKDNYPYLRFAPNEENPSLVDFFAFNGCNFINGTIGLKGAKVQPQGEFLSTLKMCDDAPYEMAISNALQVMHNLKIQTINNESFLYIKNGSGQTVMTLRKHNLNFLEGAWRVGKVRGENIPASTGMQFVIDLSNNTIHGNAGCNVLNGKLSVNMQIENGVNFSDMATTRMTCPDIALEQQFLAAMADVATAVPSGSNKALLKDAKGQTIIELHRLSKADLK